MSDKLLTFFDDKKYPKNIAPDLSDEKLKEIADKVLKGYQIDKDSRAEWETLISKAMKIARQDFERKTSPWEGASNVKFPLIPVGSISFASHSYPEIIRNGRILDCATFTAKNEEKEDKARRISDHMNWQILYEDENWETDHDRLCHTLPLVGHMFKKVYYDPCTKKNCSELCLPEEIVINNKIKGLEAARRVTHVKWMYMNDIVEKIRYGLYRDIELEKLKVTDENSPNDEDPVHEVLEQHCFIDLDDDKYEEPYTALLHKKSEQILAIYPRYEMEDIELMEGTDKVKRITPDSYFVDYVYIPSPDGSYYGLGLGVLLYPINAAINSVINQLIDSGTLANINGGFCTRDLKIRGGDLVFTPGKFTPVDSGTAEDLSKSFYPLPFKEPSAVLLQLLDKLIQAGKELATITDISTGQAQGQNTPATTASILENSSMRMFSAAQRRMIRSLNKEFHLWFKLNRKYLDPIQYFKFQGQMNQVQRTDYDDRDMDILPTADPTMSSQSQRLMKAQGLLQLINDPRINADVIFKKYFKALDEPNPEEFIVPADKRQQAPDPKVLELQFKEKELQVLDNHKQLDIQLHIKELEEKAKATQVNLINAQANMKNQEVDMIKGLEELEHKKYVDRRKLDIDEKKVNKVSKPKNGVK